MNILGLLQKINPVNVGNSLLASHMSQAGPPSGYSFKGNFQRGNFNYGSPPAQNSPMLPGGINFQLPQIIHPSFFQFNDGQRVPFQQQPLQGNWRLPTQTKKQLPIYLQGQ